jgi:hypothetical protein
VLRPDQRSGRRPDGRERVELGRYGMRVTLVAQSKQ